MTACTLPKRKPGLADKSGKRWRNCLPTASLITCHSFEKEEIVEQTSRLSEEKYGEDIQAKFSPIIRSTKAAMKQLFEQ